MLSAGLQAEDRVLNFLKQNNRPYNVQVMIPSALPHTMYPCKMAARSPSFVLQNVCDHLAQVWPLHASYHAPMLEECCAARWRPLCSLV